MRSSADPALQPAAQPDPLPTGGARQGHPGPRGDEQRPRGHLQEPLRWPCAQAVG